MPLPHKISDDRRDPFTLEWRADRATGSSFASLSTDANRHSSPTPPSYLRRQCSVREDHCEIRPHIPLNVASSHSCSIIVDSTPFANTIAMAAPPNLREEKVSAKRRTTVWTASGVASKVGGRWTQKRTGKPKDGVEVAERRLARMHQNWRSPYRACKRSKSREASALCKDYEKV
jgi:hypothetical protein